MTLLLAIAAILVACGALAIIVLRRRIERGATLRAMHKAAASERQAQERRRAELDYVLSRVDGEIEGIGFVGGSNPARRARYGEIREILQQALSVRSHAFPISGPCADAINGFRGEAGEREVVYNESGDGRWLQVTGDRDLLRWALGELLRNVAHHAGDWSRVSVLAEPTAGGIVLTVRDDGDGLDPAAAARLYSPFTPRSGSSGPGLGLYAVRFALESMGGTIEGRNGEHAGLAHRVRLPHPPEGPYGSATRATVHEGSIPIQRPRQTVG